MCSRRTLGGTRCSSRRASTRRTRSSTRIPRTLSPIGAPPRRPSQARGVRDTRRECAAVCPPRIRAAGRGGGFPRDARRVARAQGSRVQRRRQRSSRPVPLSQPATRPPPLDDLAAPRPGPRCRAPHPPHREALLTRAGAPASPCHEAQPCAPKQRSEAARRGVGRAGGRGRSLEKVKAFFLENPHLLEPA